MSGQKSEPGGCTSEDDEKYGPRVGVTLEDDEKYGPRVGVTLEDDEKYGPRVGVTLDLEGANLILERHLGKSCKSCTEVKRGFNNRTYIVVVDDPDNSSYVIRLPGIHWTKIKTEGEVAAIIFLKGKCPGTPVPEILGYCSDKKLSGIGHEYILMQHLPGVPLDDVFKDMSLDNQKIVLRQLVQILATMKQIKFSKIGSFGFVPIVSIASGLDLQVFQNIQLEDIVIGKTVDQCAGPFDNWLSYLKAMCLVEIEELNKCKFMEPQMKNLPRIQAFLEVISNPDRTPLEKVVTNPDFVFTHGDFEPRNILVDGTTVTGILDLEFSGSFPADSDWYDGFSDFGAGSPEWKIFGEEIPDDQPDCDQIESIRELFLEECRQLGTPTPAEIPGHFERAELYYFWCNICAWYLREMRKEGDEIPPHWFKERELSIKRVETVLTKYGF